MEASFKVRQDLAYWGCSAGTFEPGEEHTVSGDSALMCELAAAADAGVILELKMDDSGKKASENAVESQRDSEKALAAAMASGVWHEGNAAQAELDKEANEGVEIGGDS